MQISLAPSGRGVNLRSEGLFKKAAAKLSLAKVIVFNFDTPALFQHTLQRILSQQVEMILFFESRCGAKLQNRVVANSIVE
jgi:hypothetical protein